MTSALHLPNSPEPWEQGTIPAKPDGATALDISIRVPDGALDYGNEQGI